MLSRDSGIEFGELSQAMRDRAVWHAVVADIPASDAEGWWEQDINISQMLTRDRVSGITKVFNFLLTTVKVNIFECTGESN